MTIFVNHFIFAWRARSMPQHRKKVYISKDYLSLLVYLYLLVYEDRSIAGQDGYRKSQMKDRTKLLQDRTYAGYDWCRKGLMQGRTDKRTGLIKGQYWCRTGLMRDRTDKRQDVCTVQDGCRTGQKQDRVDKGQDECRKGWMLEWTDAEHARCSTHMDAGQIRCSTGWMHDGTDAWQDVCRKNTVFMCFNDFFYFLSFFW